ncbi:MAG: protocatechuate 3,4-dioxygenase subunit beta [Acidimicrobiales bacterium]
MDAKPGHEIKVDADPPYDHAPYRSSILRHPKHPLLVLPHGPTERHGPVFADRRIDPLDADLTRQHAGEPLGERIIVSGQVTDGAGRPITGQLVEVWQANAAGRYAHKNDQHPAPLDPNFTGAGRCLTGSDGSYQFVTVMPGAYPWKNHPNAWRPAHIHFSLFGRAFTERLVTQMYFPGDPLFGFDPIFTSVSESARSRLISTFEMETTVEEWALSFRFDMVVGGHLGTPLLAG